MVERDFFMTREQLDLLLEYINAKIEEYRQSESHYGVDYSTANVNVIAAQLYNTISEDT